MEHGRRSSPVRRGASLRTSTERVRVRLRVGSGAAARAVSKLFHRPAVSVTLRLGWCVRAGRDTPGDCVFFDIVNYGRQPVSITGFGVSVVDGKSVTMGAGLSRPPLPCEIGSHQRRIFSILAVDLVEETGKHRLRLDRARISVVCAGGARYHCKIPGAIRERLREEGGAESPS